MKKTDAELIDACTDVWLKTIGAGQEQANLATARAVYELGCADMLAAVEQVAQRAERLPGLLDGKRFAAILRNEITKLTT